MKHLLTALLLLPGVAPLSGCGEDPGMTMSDDVDQEYDEEPVIMGGPDGGKMKPEQIE